MAIFIIFFSAFSFSSVVQDQISGSHKEHFSFKDVCRELVIHESPLIEVVSRSQLDCMGKKVEVEKFCDKKLAQDPYYIRSYVDQTAGDVVCQSGRKVLFKYQCNRRVDSQYCDQEASVSCNNIKTRLAKRLDIVHSSFTQNGNGPKQLNCYFDSIPLRELNKGI